MFNYCVYLLASWSWFCQRCRIIIQFSILSSGPSPWDWIPLVTKQFCLTTWTNDVDIWNNFWIDVVLIQYQCVHSQIWKALQNSIKGFQKYNSRVTSVEYGILNLIISKNTPFGMSIQVHDDKSTKIITFLWIPCPQNNIS